MSTTEEPIIEVLDLVRKFGDRVVLDNISFKIYRGETMVIMGEADAARAPCCVTSSVR